MLVTKHFFNFPDTLFGNTEPLKITDRNVGVHLKGGLGVTVTQIEIL
jgi:hypothetical protein